VVAFTKKMLNVNGGEGELMYRVVQKNWHTFGIEFPTLLDAL